MVSMPDAFGNALMEAGNDERIVVLNADLSHSTKTSHFAAKYPERFFNFGVAEQDELSTAAGLALVGKVAVASTYAVFACRAWEQIRNTIARANLNVKLFATHAGLTDVGDGSSHQALEDIALFRVLPNFNVLVPSDVHQTAVLTKAVIRKKGPAYVRLARGEVENVYSSEDFEVGKPFVIEEGKDVSILACGLMVPRALEARRFLRKDRIDAGVVDFHTIKPFNSKAAERASRTGALVTAEEHNVVGGLFSAVSEALAKTAPVPIEPVAVNDEFGTSGTLEEVYEHFGLTARHIALAAKKAMERKE